MNFLKRLRERGLTVGLSKGFLAFSSIKYLGLDLAEKDLSAVPDKVNVKNIQMPKTKRLQRSFLGTLSSYRKFVL